MTGAFDQWVYTEPVVTKRIAAAVAIAVAVADVFVTQDLVSGVQILVKHSAKVSMASRATVLPRPHLRLRNMLVAGDVHGLDVGSKYHGSSASRATSPYGVGIERKAPSHSAALNTDAHGSVYGATAVGHRLRLSSPSFVSGCCATCNCCLLGVVYS